MPSALMFVLRPVAAGPVPPSLARAAHAAVLRLIAAEDSALAQAVHDGDGPKPLTVSNVLGLQGGHATPEHDYGLRVTLLTPALEAVAARWQAEPPPELELDGAPWRVERIASEHPWAGQQSYADLAAPALARGEFATRWSFEFAAPVTFRQRGLNQPLPLPELVWGSLLEKWNSVAPITLPEEVRRFASECIAVSRFELQSFNEPTKNHATQIGALGRCTYVAVNRDKYWCACVDTLARFAFWSGIGAGTTRGMGRARLLR